MDGIVMKEIQSADELKRVLDLCYGILGNDHPDLYGYEAWEKRLREKIHPLTCAVRDGKVICAVLGRAESETSLIIGMVACDEAYRMRGFTKALMGFFEDVARKRGYKTITLGSRADGFYEKCGYKAIARTGAQSVFQKKL